MNRLKGRSHKGIRSDPRNIIDRTNEVRGEGWLCSRVECVVINFAAFLSDRCIIFSTRIYRWLQRRSKPGNIKENGVS